MKETAPPRRTPPQRAIAAAATSETARHAADLWGASSAELRPLHAVQNFVFAVERPDGPAILRLTHESHRSVDEVEAELRWVLDLKSRGLSVAAPHLSKHDRLTESIESAHGRFTAACFQSLPGQQPDPLRPELWSDGMFEQLGALIAQLHQASYDAAWRQATLPRRTWREEVSRKTSTSMSKSAKGKCTKHSTASSPNWMHSRAPATLLV